MWFVLSGVEGTSKQVILDFLEKEEGFTVVRGAREDQYYLLNDFQREQAIVEDQINIYNYLQQKEDGLFVTNSCIWDSVEVYAKVAVQREEISAQEFQSLVHLASPLLELEPPNGVIYMKPENHMDSFDRVLLKQKQLDEEKFRLLDEAYEKYIEKIRIPVSVIYHQRVVDHIIEQVRFDLASLKSSGLTNNTIWKREFFKGGYYERRTEDCFEEGVGCKLKGD